MSGYRAGAVACIAIAAACAPFSKVAENRYVLLSEPVNAHEEDSSFERERARAEVFCAKSYKNMQTVVLGQARIEEKGGQEMITYYFSCGDRLPD